MENSLSPADIFAMNQGDKGGFSVDWIILLFIFLLALGGNGGGLFGGNGMTQNEVQRGFDNSAVMNKLDGLGEAVSTNRYESAQIGNGIQGNISALGAQMQSCCCGIERNIDSLRYDGALNTTTITNAVHAEGEATRNMFKDNEIQSLRDQLQSANLTLAQAAQTQNLLNSLRPFPQPAYITCSPYASASNCGCNGVI